MDFISIIVPIYNTEKYLEKCIESIIAQTYKNIEIILVNDGSTDNSGKICDEYSKKDKRIKVIHKKNGGVSDARNTGLEIATGNYIGFIDSDDYIEEDMYEILHNLISDNKADISIVSYNYIKNGEIIPYSSSGAIKCYNREDAVKRLILDTEIQSYSWNKLYKRELFNYVNFPNDTLLEDVSAIFEVFSKSDKIIFKDIPKYNYVFRENSTVNYNDLKKMKDYLRIIIDRYNKIKKEFPNLDKYNSYSLVMWMTRIYKAMAISDIQDENDFFKLNFDLFKDAYNQSKEYILDTLEPLKLSVLFLMLWDLEKSRELIKELHKNIN